MCGIEVPDGLAKLLKRWEDRGWFAEIKLWRGVKLSAMRVAHGRRLFGEQWALTA